MKRLDGLDWLAAKQMGRRDLEQRALDAAAHGPDGGAILTISRDYYCGGESLAKDLALRLGWRVYDKEIVEKIAADRSVETENIKCLDERAYNFLQEWCNEVFLPGYTGQAAFMRGLVHVVMSIVRDGNAVVMGRGANFLVPESKRLAVRLTAPRAWRVENYRRLVGAGAREATHAIEQEDTRRAEFVRRHFGRDPYDPLHYDVVINTEAMSSDAVQRMIITGLAARFGPRIVAARA
ncbi:MAG: AAA family ATPase [bacterium]